MENKVLALVEVVVNKVKNGVREYVISDLDGYNVEEIEAAQKILEVLLEKENQQVEVTNAVEETDEWSEWNDWLFCKFVVSDAIAC